MISSDAIPEFWRYPLFSCSSDSLFFYILYSCNLYRVANIKATKLNALLQKESIERKQHTSEGCFNSLSYIFLIKPGT